MVLLEKKLPIFFNKYIFQKKINMMIKAKWEGIIKVKVMLVLRPIFDMMRWLKSVFKDPVSKKKLK